MSGKVSSPHSFLFFLTLLVLEYANFPRDFLKELGDLMGTLTSFVTEIIKKLANEFWESTGDVLLCSQVFY